MGLIVIMGVLLCNEVHKFIGPSAPTTVCQPISLIVLLSIFPSCAWLSVCLAICLLSPVSQWISQSVSLLRQTVSQSVSQWAQTDSQSVRWDSQYIITPWYVVCFSLKIHFIYFSRYYLLCFLFQNVRHDVVYYYKPAPLNYLQPFEKFTNLPADRQLLLRSRGDFEESRKIYQTMALTWKYLHGYLWYQSCNGLSYRDRHILYLFCCKQGNG